VKLCVDNYETQDGLVTETKRCYESPFYYISYLSIIWIHFTMPLIDQYTKIKHDSLYDSHLRINKVWTPITKITPKKKLKGNPNHTITQIQYPI
jgi:hypothetical protein